MPKPHLNIVKSFLRNGQLAVDSALAEMEEHWNASDSYGRLSCLASARGAYFDLLKMANMQWRFGLGNPARTLKQAADLATRVVPKYRALQGPEREVHGFPFSNAGFVFLLLDGVVPKPVQSCWPTGWEVDRVIGDMLPDAMILRAIATRRTPRHWEVMLTSELPKISSELVVDTYRCYLAIVLAAAKQKWDDALDYVREAEGYYLKRERQASQFRICDGGGTCNAYAVDYRLAAILKICFAPKKSVLKDFDSIHLWKPTKSRRA